MGNLAGLWVVSSFTASVIILSIHGTLFDILENQIFEWFLLHAKKCPQNIVKR